MFQYFFTYDSKIPKGLEVKNFSSTHFAWLVVTFLALLFLIGMYRRLNEPSQKRMMRGIMLLIIALEILREGWLRSSATMKSPAICRFIYAVS